MDATPEANPLRMESTMPFPIKSALAAVALASALTVAQAQTTQEQDHAAHRHAGQSMGHAQHPAMGPQGHQMMMGGGGSGMTPMMQPRHVEGRIAFLKTELKITDAQSQQWTAFADALRENATAMATMHGRMMNDGTTASAPQLAERHVQMMSQCLEGMKKIAGAETTLYTVLSDEQKKTGDELLPMPMGMPMGSM
jgi:LTXXQ motif family protein